MAIVKNCFARVNGYCKQSICVDEQSEFVEALLRFTSEFGSFKFPAIFANDQRGPKSVLHSDLSFNIHSLAKRPACNQGSCWSICSLGSAMYEYRCVTVFDRQSPRDRLLWEFRGKVRKNRSFFEGKNILRPLSQMMSRSQLSFWIPTWTNLLWTYPNCEVLKQPTRLDRYGRHCHLQVTRSLHLISMWKARYPIWGCGLSRTVVTFVTWLISRTEFSSSELVL